MIIPDRTDPVFVAWCGAWLDTEGDIGMRYGSARERRTERQIYRVIVGVSQADERPLRIIQREFGGCVQARKHTFGRKRMYRITMHSKQARLFLMHVRPFMIVKAAQADLAIEAALLMSDKRIKPIEVRDRLETIKDMLHELNGFSKVRRMKLALVTKARQNKRLTRWATFYDACIDCHRTDGAHAGNGRCTTCSVRHNYRLHHQGTKQRRSARVGNWSAITDACLDCHTAAIPHGAHGFCRRCYHRRWEAVTRTKKKAAS